MDNNKDTVKKPFYKKWWVWAIIIVIAFIWLGSEGSSTSTTTSKDTATKKEAAKIVKVGEEAKAGNLGVKVLDSKEKNAISNEAGKSNATGKFVIVKLEIKNNGEEATEYSSSDFKLKLNKKTFEIDDNASEAACSLNIQEKIYNKNKKFIGSYDKFNSGLVKNTYLVFDIPKDSKLENLKLTVEGAKNTQLNLK